MVKMNKSLMLIISGVAIIVIAGVTNSMIPAYTTGIAVTGGFLAATGISGKL